MTDRQNARRPKPVTPTYLDRAAVYYLGRYASSAENLRRVLLRKAQRRLDPDLAPDTDLDAMVAATVERAIRSGLLDDRSYAETASASLIRRGTSPRTIRAKLRHKGVPAEAIKAALGDEPLDEVALARRFAERKRLGPFRPPGRARNPDKDLAALCRAGFPYRVAQAALTMDEEP